MRGVLVLWLALTGCIDTSLVPCGELACPSDQTCTLGGCASKEAAAACGSKQEREPCTAAGIDRGECLGGACRAVECGDGRISLDEVCDDGNVVAGDGCSATCASRETCGNGIVDIIDGEECDDDGPPGLSGDGCSSTCRVETETWRDRTPEDIALRTGTAAAYDRMRGRTILFGGANGDGPLGDTWEYGDAEWIRLEPLVSPPARSGHAMAFHPAGGGVILFGGNGKQGLLADTWRWDGEAWELLSPSVSPSPRAGATMALDPQSGKLLLQGGDGMLDDTWEWTGATWSLLPDTTPGILVPRPAMSTGQSFPVLVGAPLGEQAAEAFVYTGGWQSRSFVPGVGLDAMMLAYDETTHRVVGFGGIAGSGAIVDDTIELPPASFDFQLVPASQRPPGRYGAAMAYFERTVAPANGIVLFGGTSSNGLVDHTWTFAAGTWIKQLKPQRSPPARIVAALAYDAGRGRAVLFGGSDGTFVPFGDAWVWDRRGWSPLVASVAPSARHGSAMVYDTRRQTIVLFGGSTTTGRANDTWELDGPTWTQRGPAASPSPRYSHAMAYDTARGQTVLFGGSAGGGSPVDTWTYDGDTWTAHAVNGPPPRVGHQMAFDPIRERVVLFGGRINEPLGDTWEWDGTSWVERTPAVSPSPRSHHTLTYDARRRRVVLVGGFTHTNTPLSDVWEWDGTSWTLRAVAPARAEHVAAYDAVRGELILFGGTSFTGVRMATTWGLEYVREDVLERCRLADDDIDRDGLAGCADPDCWGRCDPLCPPASLCPATRPRCGDGTCSSVEDRDLCPADC